MFSCLRLFPLQSYRGYLLSYSISSLSFRNAYFSIICGDSAIANKQEKVEQVRKLLRNYGLSDAQVSLISKMNPKVLQLHPRNVLLPKLQFLHSIGISSDNLQKVITNNPWLLQRSLEKQLIPCYHFLKNLPLANKDIVGIIRRNSRILSAKVEKIASNVDALRKMGVPQSSILSVIVHHPSLVQLNCEKLKHSIDEAIRLGFNPSRMLFAYAVLVLCGSSKEAWEKKVKVYRSFGLSDSEIQLAFKKHPLCMRLSEEKIAQGLDFFVNKMGWSPAIVARRPAALFFSLEKRIVPRCQVIKVLMQKGLVKEHHTLMSFLRTSEKRFLDKFVCKYKDVLPELKDIYTAGLILKSS